MHVRELPPLRVSIDVVAPNGRHYRWAHDEPSSQDVPSGLRFSSTMPGGHETLDATLPRKPGIDYGDMTRLSTVYALDASGGIASEARLERAPRVSGEQMAISPSAVGWQAALDDDKSALEIYVDRTFGSWSEPPLARKVAIAGAALPQGGVPTNIGDGIGWGPISGQALAASDTNEVWYIAPAGLTLARLGYQGGSTGAFTNFEAPTLFTNTLRDGTGTFVGTALTYDNTVRSASPAAQPAFMLRAINTGGAVTPGSGWLRWIAKVAVYGNHGLTPRPLTGEPDGVLASDVVVDAVGRWAPLLSIADGSVQASSFVIPHLVFSELTTAAAIVREVTKYGLEDWAVWDNRIFYWHQRGARGRKWRARIAPAQLEETGPQVDRLWESIIVQYDDVAGTRTVGPPGSGADTEDSALKDTDPDNPANAVGIVRRDLLVMGTATAASAIEVGRRFLEESKLLDTSGRARFVGHVEDDRGVIHPYHRVRAGDEVMFVDASDASYRRIVRADHSTDDRTCTIDLDAPPEGLQALLERLGVVLIPLGV